jgi:hypothetical protein
VFELVIQRLGYTIGKITGFSSIKAALEHYRTLNYPDLILARVEIEGRIVRIIK